MHTYISYADSGDGDMEPISHAAWILYSKGVWAWVSESVPLVC